MTNTSLVRFAWLSIAAAVVTIGLKTSAWVITDSVGLLSDAAESLVNLAAGVVALLMLSLAERPADEGHAFGHHKAEYFSSGFEGMLIFIASLSIGITAVHRLIEPRPLNSVAVGLVVSSVAMVINLLVALVLLRVGRESGSITLEANAHHLLTDVWTSVGVIIGVGLVTVTGWSAIDPILALLVAANIARTGWVMLRRSVSGLMDSALSERDLAAVYEVLRSFEKNTVRFHALRTRQAGSRKFVTLHVLVPGNWTVQRGHLLLERLERAIRVALPQAIVFTHLESLDDPASWSDITLDR